MLQSKEELWYSYLKTSLINSDVKGLEPREEDLEPQVEDLKTLGPGVFPRCTVLKACFLATMDFCYYLRRAFFVCLDIGPSFQQDKTISCCICSTLSPTAALILIDNCGVSSSYPFPFLLLSFRPFLP